MTVPKRFIGPRSSRGTNYAKLRFRTSLVGLAVLVGVASYFQYSSRLEYLRSYAERHLKKEDEETIERRLMMSTLTKRSPDMLRATIENTEKFTHLHD